MHSLKRAWRGRRPVRGRCVFIRLTAQDVWGSSLSEAPGFSNFWQLLGLCSVFQPSTASSASARPVFYKAPRPSRPQHFPLCLVPPVQHILWEGSLWLDPRPLLYPLIFSFLLRDLALGPGGRDTGSVSCLRISPSCLELSIRRAAH